MPETLTRKLGPLPVYVWALIVVAAYLVYTRYKSGSANAVGGSTSPTGVNPVPAGDSTLSGSGGIGAATIPDVVTNIYLPAPDAGQASGGGTSTGTSSPGTTPTTTTTVTTSSDQVAGAPASMQTSGAGKTSYRPPGRVTAGGGITGRGQQGGL